MKKTVLLWTVLMLFTGWLTGCGEEKRDFDDIYLVFSDYMIEGDFGRTAIPAKLNVLTGDITPLCTDPLCFHTYDSSCPLKDYNFTGPGWFYDGWFYYSTADMWGMQQDFEMSFCRYDAVNARVEVLAPWPNMGYMTRHEGEYAYIHFSEAELTWKIDLASGKITEKEEKDFEILQMVSSVAVGDYEYFTRQIDNPPVLGYDLNDKEDRMNTTGGILWRRNLKTGEEEKVYEDPQMNLDWWKIDKVGDAVVVGYTNVDYENYTADESIRWGTIYNYKTDYGWIVYRTDTGETACYRKYPEV
ncbi:MAG: hypothetical protein IJC71_03235 [Clostridia bacterium]|nr:hypothetical protein [Clostridia bacterium]